MNISIFVKNHTVMKLKYVVLMVFSVFLLNSQKSSGQNFFEFAYNAATPMVFDDLNFVIDRYNETRNFLDVEMKNITFLDGKTYTLGERFGKYSFSIGYTGAGMKVKAEGVDNSGFLVQRQLKVKTSVFDLCFSRDILQMENAVLEFGAGLHYGRFKIKTRVDYKEDIRKADWVYINDSDKQMFAISAFLKYSLFRPGFFIQPYLQYTPGDFSVKDITGLNEAINPYTWSGDPSPLEVSNTTIGLKIGYRFYYME
ncbi:MAG: hypothetical protein C0592_13130 [Marinilabiliales bacterium]|nr:MAG: hypothetical protein C0592_13130 [Marinilabiliales bacterium]